MRTETTETETEMTKEIQALDDGWDDFDDGDEEDYAPHATEVADPDTGRIRVLADKCGTCVFHPDNRMHLAPGRLKQLIREILAKKGHLVCHSTLPGMAIEPTSGAICNGFAANYFRWSVALLVGEACGMLQYVDEPQTYVTKMKTPDAG